MIIPNILGSTIPELIIQSTRLNALQVKGLTLRMTIWWVQSYAMFDQFFTQRRAMELQLSEQITCQLGPNLNCFRFIM